MTPVRVLAPARAEIHAAMRSYESRRKGLGLDFVAMIDEALQRIGRLPEAAPAWRTDRSYRRLVVRRFPFVVVFEISDVVTVVAVAHQRRRPGYWLDR